MKQTNQEYTVLHYMIQNEVSIERDFDLELIKDFLKENDHILKTQDRERVYQRRYLAYLVTHKLGYTRKRAGEILGGKDHTTIVYAIKKHHEAIEVKDKMYRGIINELNKELEAFRKFGIN